MSLPIVMIFGNHRDPAGDHLIKNLLPKLAVEGYNRLCIEFPSSKTEANILDETIYTIKLIQSRHNPSANQYLAPFTFKKEALNLARKHFYCTICIDDEQSLNECAAISDEDLQLKMFRKTLYKRDIIMADHLFRMHAENKGVITLNGPGHCQGIIEHLKKKGLRDEDFIYHFPQSFKFSSSLLERFRLTSEEIKILKECASCTPTEEEINLLGNKILKEVKSKNRSVVEITENAQSKFLSDFFKASFKALLKPEYYADAILSIDQMNNRIRKDLDDLSISYHIDQNYLVIPKVNTTEIAQSIRLLPYKV